MAARLSPCPALLFLFATLLPALTGLAQSYAGFNRERNPQAAFRFTDGHSETPLAVFHQQGDIVVPGTSLQKAKDRGLRAHTNHLILVPATSDADAAEAQAGAADAVTDAAYIAETPAALRQVYSLPATGGAGVIAIISVGHYPTALNDFNVFSRYFGLPKEASPNSTNSGNRFFQVIYAAGERPAANPGWAQEAALDIESAHAMAPRAKIVLVEAASNSWLDILAAVAKANTLPFLKEVSMSFGSSEFPQETAYDAFFTKPGVVYVAASGDVGGEILWPGCSRNVVSAGGTSIMRDSAGLFTRETGWAETGGGLSVYERAVSYQVQHPEVAPVVGNRRGVPDVAFDADPNSGVYVYDSTPYAGRKGWLIAGGTSVSAPSIAGILNSAATARGYFLKTTNELTLIYNNIGTDAFRDVTQGAAGGNNCVVGYDLVTGVGSLVGLLGK